METRKINFLTTLVKMLVFKHLKPTLLCGDFPAVKRQSMTVGTQVVYKFYGNETRLGDPASCVYIFIDDTGGVIAPPTSPRFLRWESKKLQYQDCLVLTTIRSIKIHESQSLHRCYQFTPTKCRLVKSDSSHAKRPFNIPATRLFENGSFTNLPIRGSWTRFRERSWDVMHSW